MKESTKKLLDKIEENHEYLISSELGIMRFEASSLTAAKKIYAEKSEYDFAGAEAGDYPGTYYDIQEDGVPVESFGDDVR